MLFKDAYGGTVNAAADGAETLLLNLSKDRRDFMLVALYVDEGVVETYNVITGSNGIRQALWTTNRPSSSFNPKVAAFRAVCD